MQCDNPEAMKLAAKLARLQVKAESKADARRARQRRKDVRVAHRLANGPARLLGVPWERVEELVVAAVSMDEADADGIDVERVASIAWKMIVQTGIVPAPLRVDAVGDIVIAHVLVPMVRRVIGAAVDLAGKRSKKARDEYAAELAAAVAAVESDDVDEPEPEAEPEA